MSFVQQLSNTSDKLTIDKIISQLKTHDRFRNKIEEKGNEVGYSAKQVYSKEPMMNVNTRRPECTHCGKTGHTMDKCFTKRSCNHCGKMGHHEDTCFKEWGENLLEVTNGCVSIDKHTAPYSIIPYSIVPYTKR